MPVDRQPFYEPERVFAEAEEKVDRCQAVGESIDYLAFVPDGEPTLDVNLGKEIELLRNLGVKIAVLTNASLIDRDDVKDELAEADLVSLKVDAVSEDIWQRVNRPHKSLNLSSMLAGMRDFAKMFRGQVISETMLIEEVNDTDEEVRKIAAFLMGLQPRKAYIAIPTRPPAEMWVRGANEQTLNMAYQVLSASIGMDRVEFLTGYEGNAFASTGNIEEDLVSITSVHPMRRDAVEHMLGKAKADWEVVERLLKESKLIQIEHNGCNFYMRKLPSRS
jgi:wyosine [tRNA(Phe)-imidazoG37] synthetase (radical SAM superfamily)